MIRFLLYRFGLGFVTACAAVSLVFLCVQLLPGDPFDARFESGSAGLMDVDGARARLGFDRPILDRLAGNLLSLLQGDLGTSWASGLPVSTMIEQQIGPTLTLASSSVLIALGLGVTLGVISAVRPADRALSAVVALILATPTALLGALVAGLYTASLGSMPATRQLGIQQILLPPLVVGLSLSGSIANITARGVRSTLAQPFMLMAKAKGLSRRDAILKHGLRVGLIPVVELASIQIGFLITGTMITETLFARPGLGRVLVSGILSKDVPVVQSIVILSVLSYSAARLLSDILVVMLDPRLRSLNPSET